MHVATRFKRGKQIFQAAVHLQQHTLGLVAVELGQPLLAFLQAPVFLFN